MAEITEAGETGGASGHVTLAEHDGQVWLVGGEEHLDMLLVNKLPPGVTIELVNCASKAEMYALWEARSSEPTDGAQPWVLNPLITGRMLGGLGLAPGVVQFTAWSAMLDGAAESAIGTAAGWLNDTPGGTLLLRQFAAKAPAPGQADMQRLRGQLVLAALGRAGADVARIREEAAPAEKPAEAERLHIVMEPPG